MMDGAKDHRIMESIASTTATTRISDDGGEAERPLIIIMRERERERERETQGGRNMSVCLVENMMWMP